MRKEKQTPLLKLMYERKKAGLTQGQLGERVGVKGFAVYQWEKGSRQPNAEMLNKLASALSCKVDDII